MAATPPPASVTIASSVHRIQLSLLESGAPSDLHLLAAGALLSRADYDDVVVERTIADLCGYPLCSNPLPSHHPHKGRFHVSLREHRVYDLDETYKYCSLTCLVASRAFSASLPSGRSYDLTASAVKKALRLFGFGEASELQEEQLSSGKDGDLGFSNLTILEKEDPGSGEVSLEEWIGPANAVEGYVPPYELKKGSKNNAKQETKGRNGHSRGNEVEFYLAMVAIKIIKCTKFMLRPKATCLQLSAFFEKTKVLSSAQLSGEEYDSTMDLLLPLGRD